MCGIWLWLWWFLHWFLWFGWLLLLIGCCLFISSCGKLRLEGHNTLVGAEVSDRRITHGQVILGRNELPTVVTDDRLVGGGLQVNPVQRQTVQRTEQLILVIGVHSFYHVKVPLLRVTPCTSNNFLLLRFEFVDAHIAAESFLLPFKLDKLWSTITVAVRATIITRTHCQFVGVLESGEAWITTQSVELTF
jgi:hypothetical protein